MLNKSLRGGRSKGKCPQTKGVRNGKIEFLRFVFSVIILIHHSRYIFGDDRCMFLGGSLAVEFFFFVSGYLMMGSIEKNMRGNVDELGKETRDFLWRKVKSVYPDLLVAWVISLIVTTFVKKKSILGMAALAVDSFFELTLLKMSGLYSISLNGVTWYVSSMILCMCILYPLIRRYPDMMIHVVLPLIALTSLGFLSGQYGAPRDPLRWVGFTYKGNLRALGELSLGALCYQAVKVTGKIELTRMGKTLVTITEWSFYILLILYMYYAKASERDYFFLLIMAVGVGLSFSHKGIDADLFDNCVCIWLGRWSLPLYLGHTFYAYYLNNIVPDYFSDHQKWAAYLTCAVMTSFAIWGISTLIKRSWPSIMKKIRKMLLV